MDRYDRSWMDRVRDASRDNRFMRSGFVTGIVLIAVVGSFSLLWYAHIRGRLHKVVNSQYEAETANVVRVGGMELVHLNRLPMSTSMTPEFVSATLAPGLGMRVLQANLSVPTRGEVPLLVDSIDEATGNMLNDAMASAIRVTSAARTGTHWSEPVDLLANRQVDQLTASSMPDGGGSDALFKGIPLSGPTLENGIQTNVSITLSGHAIDIAVIARNMAEQPRAVTLSWQPHFRLPVNASTFTMIPPLVQNSTGVIPAPVPLDRKDVNLLYTKLKHSYLGNGPEVQLRDETAGYILHLTAISPSVKSLRVESSQKENYVMTAFSTSSAEDGEDEQAVLNPGESLQLRLRLEVSVISNYVNH